MSLRILILGGYGTFGGRLAKLLAQEQGVELLIAGRSLDKAAAFCAGLRATNQPIPVALDRNGDVQAVLESLRPDLIVDASGPFQLYGDDPYRVVEAALALGIDYLDFADGADFVAGIRRFDAAARARGVFLLSGVSTLPALTATVARKLAQGLASLDSIMAGIAPAPIPEAIGPNVVRAILGYAGRPIGVLRDGRPATAFAITETRRFTIAPPGALPHASRRFSLVEAPDLRLLPERWPELRLLWIGAGPVPAFLHRLLIACAWVVRIRLIPSLLPTAGLFHWVFRRFCWGERRGGMFVAVTGRTASGETVERSWHLVAEGEDGPLIPAMGAAAIVRRCLSGQRPAAGARAAIGELELEDYERLFANRAIATGIRELNAATAHLPLFHRVLGEAWADIPEEIRSMHDVADECRAEGRATVERGTGLMARLVGALFRFPSAGRDLPVTVTMTQRAGRETWRRRFGGDSFASTMSAGTGRAQHLIVERFGPFAFGFALVWEGDRLRLVLRRWTFLGLPLPLVLAPSNDSYEHAGDGRFHFHVDIGHPLFGPIVRYRGWLVPVASGPA